MGLAIVKCIKCGLTSDHNDTAKQAPCNGAPIQATVSSQTTVINNANGDIALNNFSQAALTDHVWQQMAN